MVSQSLHFILGFLCGGFIILVGGLRVGDRVGCGYCNYLGFFRPSSPVILFILGLIFLLLPPPARDDSIFHFRLFAYFVFSFGIPSSSLFRTL